MCLDIVQYYILHGNALTRNTFPIGNSEDNQLVFFSNSHIQLNWLSFAGCYLATHYIKLQRSTNKLFPPLSPLLLICHNAIVFLFHSTNRAPDALFEIYYQCHVDFFSGAINKKYNTDLCSE